MIDRRENERRDWRDAEVSAAYQASKNTATPLELDEQVMQAARSAASAKSPVAALVGWLRPATYLATLCLCVFMITNLNRAPMYVERDLGSSSQGVDSFGGAAEQAAQQLEQADIIAAPKHRRYARGAAASGIHRAIR